MRLIDADKLCEEFKERQRAALRWKEKAILDGDEERQIRADATLAFLSEVKLTIDNAPTIEYSKKSLDYDYGFAEGLRRARKKGKWIPVSERLPEEEDYRDCYGLPDGCVLWQTDSGDIGFGWYYHLTKCWSDLNDNLIISGKVIAWQPLPEPYKEAEK